MPNKGKGLSKKGSRAKRQSSKPSQYRYTPLQTPQSIRRLQLSRGERDDPIQCYLFEVRLDDWPHYEAVSYMWGDPIDESTLNCNNKTISVPHNLVEGLRKFRRPDRLRILWADAVCINQQDLEERGSQVALMARVFSEASRVLVWLGHGDSAMIQRAYNYICRCLNHEGDVSTARYLWGTKQMPVDNSETITFENPIDDVTSDALRHIFGCPYFSRGWIVQELVLPKWIEVYHYEACINYYFLEAFERTRSDYDMLLRSLGICGGLSIDSQWIGLNRFRKICDFRFNLHESQTLIAFVKMLLLARRHKFRDPRDYVYGFLGLERLCRDMRFKRPLLKPDYTIGLWECYKLVAATLLIDHGDIGILILVNNQDLVPENLPSWVPNFCMVTEDMLNSFYYTFKPAMRLGVTASRQKCGGFDCMRIRGIRVSKLNIVTTERRRDVRVIKTLINTLSSRHGERRVAWTMTCGLGVKGGGLWPRPASEPDHMDAYRKFVLPKIAETERQEESVEEVREDTSFYHGVCTILSSYALFETEDNQLGISYPFIQPGDQVVIFLGGRMPFVLRPVGEKWRLIGLCYVHDIMDGEPVKQMKHDPRYMAEDFDII